MRISETIRAHLEDPAAVEACYRQAQHAGDEKHFSEAIKGLYRNDPGHLLLQAWHYRLAAEPMADTGSRSNPWRLAGVLSLLTGFVFWALSDETLVFFPDRPVFLYLWSPIAVLFVVAFLSFENPERRRRALRFGGLLALVTLYAVLIGHLGFSYQSQYVDLVIIHLPLLSWAAVGLVLATFTADRLSVSLSRFAFIRKSLEVFVTGGLYLAAGMIFGGITIGMFEALDVNLPPVLLRLIAAGGAGLLPIIAVASVYDVHFSPEKQQFGQGVGRLVPIITQLLLPLAIVVLLIYVALIPFNFYSPFRDREVLMVYNIMLFAVVALLVGITPARQEDIAPVLRPWVQRGVTTLAVLAVLVGLYALAAILTRTVEGGWTANRITVIGWDVVNIGLLVHTAYSQFRLKEDDWATALKKVFSNGAMVYIAWALGLMLLLPLVLALV